ncbi:hypothetical protein QQ045_019667 [Rhodiola kirilowii]
MLLREISHENVVQLVNVHINHVDMSLYLAFDYAEHDLYEIIRHHRDKVNQPMNQYTVKSLLWQLLNGLNYLHRFTTNRTLCLVPNNDEDVECTTSYLGLAVSMSYAYMCSSNKPALVSFPF